MILNHKFLLNTFFLRRFTYFSQKYISNYQVSLLNKESKLKLNHAVNFDYGRFSILSRGVKKLKNEDDIKKDIPKNEEQMTPEDFFKKFFNGEFQTKTNKKVESEQPNPNPFKNQNSLVQIFTVCLVLYVIYQFTKNSVWGVEMTWKEFVNGPLRSRSVERLVVRPNNIVEVYLKELPTHSNRFFVVGSVEIFEKNLEDAQIALGMVPDEFIQVMYRPQTSGSGEGSWLTTIIGSLITLAIFAYLSSTFLGSMIAKRGGKDPFSFGKSPARVITPDPKSKTTFKDIAGCDEAKQEVMEFVQFLKEPTKFQRLGAKVPKGAILHGPPGTGKTLLAKAVAGEAGVSFITMSGSEFIEMFVGVGSSRVRDLFKTARANAPSIIFIDEIDAIGSKRSGNNVSSFHEHDSTLNQLLVEMDGFNSNLNVIVLAGTNRMDILDPALLRPGRFDRQIFIGPPDIKGRYDVFKIHLNPLQTSIDKDEIAKRMAALTPGFTGADIANICNEAALIAARFSFKSIDMNHFEQAVDRVVAGSAKNTKLSAIEKETVAYHEAGHCITSWFLKNAYPIMKVSIIPRGKALGYNQFLPSEDHLNSEEQLMDQMCVLLGGRASEEIFLGKVTNGAVDDLQRVTKLAYNKIGVFGMDKEVGKLSFQSIYEQSRGNTNYYREFGSKMSSLIDDNVKKLVEKAYQRTLDLINNNRESILKVVEKLQNQETITHKELVELLGARPFEKTQNERFLDGSSWIQSPTAN